MSPAVTSKPSWWITPVAVLSISALVVAAILLLKPQLGALQPQPGTPVAATWDAACGAERASDFKCFEKHYQGIIAGPGGVAAAFVDMKDAYERSPFAKGQCHQLVHVIGRAAADRYGDVAQAYDKGDNLCWSGYYHGVMESVIGKIGYDNIRAKLNTICSGVSQAEQYSFFHYNCVHGLGHGVMVVNKNELFDSLSTCDSLTDGWERESCFGGVFMENVMAETNPDHGTKYLKKDDLLYPCNAVKRPYKQQCFLMQTSHALQSNGYDFDAVFTLCDKVEFEFRATCHQSLGRDASGNTVSDAARTRDICLRGSNYDARMNCITGAVKDFIAYFHSKEEGQKLCAVLEPTLRDACMATAESFYLGTK